MNFESRARRVLVGCAMIASAAGTLAAQSTTQGAISGTVFDASGAAIPNAAIVIHNNGTNADLRLASGGSGEYNAPQLAPGTYTVTVSAPGFSEQRTAGVVVQVNLATQVNVHLVTGQATEVVDVTAAPPDINFESPVYGGHLENKEIESIPVNNRRWSSLALTTPGVVNDTNGFGLLSFRAISPLLNNVEIDGADDNQAFFSEERGRTRAGYSTSQAAVREFQVNTGVYSAEYGRAVGGVVNSVTKSGTNELHGELYFYNRNSSRSAFQPFATNTTYNAANNTYVTAPYKPKDNRNQYGFGVGGPLVKDKLFWFYSFDVYARNFPGTAKANNPSAFFVAPDLALPSGQTCNTTSGSVTTSTGKASSIDSSTCLLAARLGVSYSAAANAYNGQLQALLGDLGPVPRYGHQDINTPRIDWQPTSKEHVSFLYHRMRWDSPGGVQTQSTNNYAVDSFGTDFVKLDYGIAVLDSEITQNLTNELRYQYGRELDDEGRQNPSAYTSKYLTNSSGIPVQVGLYTSIGFTLGTPYYSFRAAYPDERKWQIGDTGTLVHGKHSIRFGEDIVHNYDLQNNLYESNGVYNYSSIVNFVSDIVSGGKTCNASGSGVGSSAGGSYACYSSFVQGFGTPAFDLSTVDYGFFVQDDWKARPNLTLNVGLRYDYEHLPAPFSANPALPETSNHPSDKNNFGPRLGFAWDPYGTGNTVLRGGYGMYYGRIFNAMLLNAYSNTGVGGQATYNFSSTTTSAPVVPNVLSAAPGAAAVGANVQYLDKHLQNPYAHQFDLALQQNLGKQNVLTIAYIGALSRELPNYLNVNLNPAATYTFNYTVAAGTNGSCGPVACGTVIPVKVYASKKQTGATASTYTNINLNPAYGAITDVVSNINANYNGLTIEATNRSSKYATFDVNYTWSHALDFNQNQSTAAGTNNWFDPYANPRSNYGNSNLDVKHRLVAWGIFNAPGLQTESALKYLTNGWSIKPLLQVQTGLPYSVTLNGTTPNQCYYAGCLEAAGTGLSGTGVTYIPALGRNTFRQPISVILDARAEKDFNFETDGHNVSLQLIGEAFNLPNHENVTGVNSTGYSLSTSDGSTTAPTISRLVYQPTFGSITSANSNYAYGTRQVQLAVRLLF